MEQIAYIIHDSGSMEEVSIERISGVPSYVHSDCARGRMFELIYVTFSGTAYYG
jgi:hypothetical protein